MYSNIQRSARSLALLSVLAGTMALTTGLCMRNCWAAAAQFPGERDPRSVGFAGQRP